MLSEDTRERLQALAVIKVLDPEFAARLAVGVASDPAQPEPVRQAAGAVSPDNWFAVVAAYDTLEEAKIAATALPSEVRQMAAIYSDGRRFHLTLGGHLSYDETERRAASGRRLVDPESYAFYTTLWDQNLLQAPEPQPPGR